MTYKESYLMCNSIEQIKEFAIHDICVAKTFGLSARIKKIRKSADGKADNAVYIANEANTKSNNAVLAAEEAVNIANEAVGVADDYKDIAIANAEKSRGYAEGKKLNGEDNPEYANANSKYHAEQSALKAGEAEEHKNTAKTYRDASIEAAEYSRKFAEGKGLDGTPDEIFAENNSKYYRDQAQGIAEQMATDVETIETDISDLQTDKADKVTGATVDNFASLDADGNLKDSGAKVSDLEPALPSTPTDPEIKYLNGNKQWSPIVIGSGGQTVLEASQWVDNVYNINITQLGNYDAIFLTPSALADKTALESANIIISTNGSTVIFTAEISPTVDISLEYFISRGRANE